MSTFLLKIKNLIKHLSNFFKINPHKHWIMLLYIFFTLTVMLILFSCYILFEIKNEQMFQVKEEQKEKPNLLKEELLKNTLERFDQKTKVETDITSNPLPYKDPSI